MARFIPQGMGWIPDLPDARDFTCVHAEIAALLEQLKPFGTSELPDEVDLRQDACEEVEFFSPPEDQGTLNSSSAFAALSLVEYFERRCCGRTFEGSKLFLYKVTRNRLRLRGDTGADLRTTLKTIVQFGVPPERYWPYDVVKFDEEPSPFLYRIAKPLSCIRYFRLDRPNADGKTNWQAVKLFLAAGFPIAFGFSVPSSLTDSAKIPYRPDFDSIRGGQAVVAIGYRLNHFARGQHALLIRNSWGSQWGDSGFGWLPAEFVYRQLARDFLTVMRDDSCDLDELTNPLPNI